jgi:hypothetical protein
VEKNHGGVVTPIEQPEAHLVAIEVAAAGPPTRRRVEVTNQFGTEVLTVGAPDMLLVPSAKSLAPTPPGAVPRLLDHFLCYDVRGENDDHDDRGRDQVRARVVLTDQFGQEDVDVGEAVRLCNPVAKTHGGVTTPIESADEHLTCYDIDGERGRPARLSAIVRHQFGVEHLRVGSARALCVPSQKRLMSVPTQSRR